jgi:hypothetical protein
MARNKYTTAESVILPFFASRGFTQRSCAALIEHKLGVESVANRPRFGCDSLAYTGYLGCLEMPITRCCFLREPGVA